MEEFRTQFLDIKKVYGDLKIEKRKMNTVFSKYSCVFDSFCSLESYQKNYKKQIKKKTQVDRSSFLRAKALQGCQIQIIIIALKNIKVKKLVWYNNFFDAPLHCHLILIQSIVS